MTQKMTTQGKENIQDVTFNKEILKQLGFMEKNLIPAVFTILSIYKISNDTIYRITKIDNEVFKDCNQLQTITIPDTVREIGESAFENCSSLEKIYIPYGVTKIGNRAFANCESLNNITISNSVTEIGNSVFVGCYQLQQFTLPTKYTIFKDDVHNNHFKTYQIGDYRKFGSYPQNEDGQEHPIEWQVLSIENNKMLVISRYGLAAKRFDSNSNNWSSSEIHKWLNNEFYNKAFNEQEKKCINSSNLSDVGTTDNVFLLSKEEAEKYFVNDNARKCKATDYAKKNGGWANGNGDSVWWLRSSGLDISYGVFYVYRDGSITRYDVKYDDILVRPALWINL